MTVARLETSRSISYQETPPGLKIFTLGNGKDFENPYPSSRSQSQEWADKCFRHESTKPAYPPRILTGPRALDALLKRKLGSTVRPDALVFLIDGKKRRLKELLEFGVTGVELKRKSEGMVSFVKEMREGDYLGELFEMLEISGIPIVEKIGGISLTFIRQHVPMDTVYEYSPFARVSVKTLGR